MAKKGGKKQQEKVFNQQPQTTPTQKKGVEIKQALAQKIEKKSISPIPSKQTPGKGKFPLTAWEVGGVIFSLCALFVFLLPGVFALGLVKQPSQTVLTTPPEENKDVAIQAMLPETIETLSGELIEEKHTRFPVAVMIDNHSSARPQSNLQEASIVYESLVEGSITRFMAIFDKGVQDKIGPIRSSRPYFLIYWDAIDGPYMHAGGSPEALLKIRQFDIKDVNMGKYYWRAADRPAPHNLYTSSDLQTLMLRDTKWDQIKKTFGTWKFSDNPTLGADSGNGVDVYFSGRAEGSHVRFTYDITTRAYKRFQAGVEHLDAASNKQLAAKTVIIMEIPPIAAIGDHGRLTLQVTGEGKAHMLFDGKRVEGTWKKTDSSVRETLYDAEGAEIAFPRGPIWIEVIPSDHQVTFE